MVEFDGLNNIGWYDIGLDFLKIVDKPARRLRKPRKPNRLRPLSPLRPRRLQPQPNRQPLRLRGVSSLRPIFWPRPAQNGPRACRRKTCRGGICRCKKE